MADYKNDVRTKVIILVSIDQWILFKLEYSLMQSTTMTFLYNATSQFETALT